MSSDQEQQEPQSNIRLEKIPGFLRIIRLMMLIYSTMCKKCAFQHSPLMVSLCCWMFGSKETRAAGGQETVAMNTAALLLAASRLP